MSNIQTGAERMPHDLPHLGFLAGQIGRLITISTTPVIAGDSFEMDAVGALRLEGVASEDRKSGSAGMPRPISYAVFCLKKKKPVAVKDVISTRGIKTRCGSKIFENYVPPYDATSFSLLDVVVVVNLGTTNIYTLSLHDALPICQIGRLITISTTPVIAGDSFEMDAVGALRLEGVAS